MPIANAYKESVQNIINKLNAEITTTKPKRHLSTLVRQTYRPILDANNVTCIILIVFVIYLGSDVAVSGAARPFNLF
jgi:hypothetical protein